MQIQYLFLSERRQTIHLESNDELFCCLVQPRIPHNIFNSLCGLFRIYRFDPLNFTLSWTIWWSVKLKSSGKSWNSLHETKQTKAWSSIYCSHNAAEQQCSETCFCSCLQQMLVDFVFPKLLTSPVLKNSPMTCSSSFFETSTKFQVFCKSICISVLRQEFKHLFDQLLEVLQ